MQDTRDYQRIAQAIRFIQERAQAQPDLNEIAGHLNLSSEHCQRLFKRWAGVSPKRFLQCLTVEYAKNVLKASGNIMDAAFSSGLSSSSRLHDHFITLEAMTPGEYQLTQSSRHKNKMLLTIRHGIYESPFGEVWLAATDKGICQLQFIPDNSRTDFVSTERLVSSFLQKWPNANQVRDDHGLKHLVDAVFLQSSTQRNLVLHVNGSNFQIQIWKALLTIPSGALCSYSQLALAIGRPAANRAVANAVGANPIAYVIPCHRVIRSTGLLGGYHWGIERKQALLMREIADTV